MAMVMTLQKFVEQSLVFTGIYGAEISACMEFAEAPIA
jgi:hypothetical protein